jgi:hypothetical protein
MPLGPLVRPPSQNCNSLVRTGPPSAHSLSHPRPNPNARSGDCVAVAIVVSSGQL